MNFNCEQLSGIAELNFYLLEEVSNWPVVVTDLSAGQLVFTPEVNDVEGTIDPDSINIDVTPKLSAEGTTHGIAIDFRFITRSESLEQLLEQYSNKPGVVEAVLNNGFKKLYGTNEEPLFLIFRTDDGKKISDAGGTFIAIKGETRSRPVYRTVL